MKVKIKKSGSVKIDHSVLNEARKICKENGRLIFAYVTDAVKEKNQTEKKQIS